MTQWPKSCLPPRMENLHIYHYKLRYFSFCYIYIQYSSHESLHNRARPARLNDVE